MTNDTKTWGKSPQVLPDVATALVESSGGADLSQVEVVSGAKVVVHQDFEDMEIIPIDITGNARQVRTYITLTNAQRVDNVKLLVLLKSV